MKRLLSVFLVLVVLTGAKLSIPPQPVQAQQMFQAMNYPTGLVGWWKICGDTSATSGCAASSSTTVYDSSQYHNNGTWSGTQGGTTNWYSAGHVGPYAGEIVESPSNVINIAGSSAWLPSSTITVIAWLDILNFTNPSYGNLLANNWCSTPGAWYLGYGGANATARFSVQTSAGGCGTGSASSISALSTGTWYCVAGTFDGTTTRLYLNGTAQNSSTASSGQALYTGTAGLSASTNTGATSYLLNNLQVYNRALSAGEIAAWCGVHN